MSVSTSRASSSTPRSAWSPRRAPSNENGFVTMPTVSAPTSRAIRATTGAAPVPVPPPAGPRAGAGAAPGAGCDEHHVRALQVALDLVVVLDGGGPAQVRVRAGA